MKVIRLKSRSLILSLFGLFLLSIIQSCAGPNIIRKDGLHYIQLGDPMPAQSEDSLAGYAMIDTSFTEGDYNWPGRILKYPEGQVLLEADIIQGLTLNRIRIETPELHLKNGLSIGADLSELWKKSQHWTARPFVRYGLIEMISPDLPRMVFLLQEEGFDYENAPEMVALDELSPDSKVVMIVLL